MTTEARTVHASNELGQEIVRYDRAGKYYLEQDGYARQHLTLGQAVSIATHVPDWQINYGLMGGSSFDLACRREEDKMRRKR